jgi:transcriptional regulator with XRE-family HTH domain
MRVAGAARRVHNRLTSVLARLDVPLGELARRTMLPPRVVARLRSPRADPPLAVAARVARALDVRVETIFSLGPRRRGGVSGTLPSRTGLGPILAERRLSDVELAQAAGLDRAHVNRLKNGRARPSVGTALAIARALGVDVVAAFPTTVRPRPRRSVAVGRSGVRRAAVGAALLAEHHVPAEVDGEG